MREKLKVMDGNETKKNNMNRERLTMYEEVRIIVSLESKILEIRNKMESTNLDFLKEMYEEDIREFQTIIDKLT